MVQKIKFVYEFTGQMWCYCVSQLQTQSLCETVRLCGTQKLGDSVHRRLFFWLVVKMTYVICTVMKHILVSLETAAHLLGKTYIVT